jgi:hypothetical protein
VNLSFSPDGGENGGLLGGRGSPMPKGERREKDRLYESERFVETTDFSIVVFLLTQSSSSPLNLHQHMMRQRLRTFLF